jgi:chromosome segregation ATPase
MSWITDLLKEVPLSAVLKEKIATIEAKYAATETENAILKDDLRDAKAEIAKLKKQAEELAHTDDDLHETERDLLTAIAELDKDARGDILAAALKLHPQRADFHLHKLKESGYVGSVSFGDSPRYYLHQKAREYLISHGLI